MYSEVRKLETNDKMLELVLCLIMASTVYLLMLLYPMDLLSEESEKVKLKTYCNQPKFTFILFSFYCKQLKTVLSFAYKHCPFEVEDFM